MVFDQSAMSLESKFLFESAMGAEADSRKIHLKAV